MLISAQPSTHPRTLLVDDHPTFRAGLRLLLQNELDIVGEATLLSEALAIAEQQQPEIAFVDLALPGADGVEVTIALLHAVPACQVIGLSGIDEPTRIVQMLRAGANGYVLKTQPVTAMVDAVRCVLSGVRYLPPSVSLDQIDAMLAVVPSIETLTPRELQVFELLVDGRSNQEVATMLFISIRTVEVHRQRLMSKLGATSSVELLRFAMRHGLTRR